METILKALQKIKRPGTFVTSGIVEPCLLELEIAEIGTIGFPLNENLAQAIIKQCYQAPYGRGEETILDKNVRCTWQMDSQNIHIHNPQWQIIMCDLVKKITEQLGLGDSRVSHHLYKLLMYEKGDFFATHRDTEKVDKMFATLMIALPSKHEGGELFVRHNQQEEMIYFGGENKHYQIQYAAFYADCQHEVKPVKRGYRCCLVYNLALENSRKQPLAPNNNVHIEQLSKLIKKRFEQKSSERLAILLEHQYTKAGLAFENLKNADRMKVDVLLQAAKQAECEAHLAIVTRWESGSADGYGGYYDDDDYEMEEVYESSLSVDHWIAPDGQQKQFGEINIDEEDIIAESNLEDRDPEQQVHEAAGNEGVSMERWYKQAALILWPRHQHFSQLCQAGQHYAIPQLKEMMQNLVGQAKNTQLRQSCQQFATEIVKQWNISDRYARTEDHADSQTMFELLITIGEVELLQQFMKTVLTQALSGKEGKAIVKVCQQHGWLTFQQELSAMVEQKPENIFAYVPLFEQLCAFDEPVETERLTLCQALAPKVLATLKKYDNSKTQQYSWFSKTPERAAPIESLFKSLYRIGETKILSNAVAHFSTEKTNYPLHSSLIPAIKKLTPWFAHQTHPCVPFQKLLQHCINDLKSRTKTPVVMPTDWKQNITLSCTCADCQELQTFIKHPTEQIHRFRVRKDRRQHLHQQIDHHHCDMTHKTERQGSPHTLVCTKNYSSYEKRQKQWEIDSDLLKELQQIKVRK